MIFVIDNYDSFTYNIVHYLGELGAEMVIKRNDQVTVDDIIKLSPSHLLVSPGPCSPTEAGISVEAIIRCAGLFPILGICLGHQSIGQAFGAEIVRAKYQMHGKTSPITHENQGIFRGMPNPFTATRYHSLCIQRDSLPDCLEITAEALDDNEIMGIRHRSLPIQGVQFHPESILTEDGKQLLANFLHQTV